MHKALLKQSQALSNIIQAWQWRKKMLMHSLQKRQGLLCQTYLKMPNQARGKKSNQVEGKNIRAKRSAQREE